MFPSKSSVTLLLSFMFKISKLEINTAFYSAQKHIFKIKILF